MCAVRCGRIFRSRGLAVVALDERREVLLLLIGVSPPVWCPWRAGGTDRRRVGRGRAGGVEL